VSPIQHALSVLSRGSLGERDGDLHVVAVAEDDEGESVAGMVAAERADELLDGF